MDPTANKGSELEKLPQPEPEQPPAEQQENGETGERWGGTRDHKPGHKPPGKPQKPEPTWGGPR